MPRLAVGIEYAGGAYHGWQTQSGAPSVQPLIEAALGSVAATPIAIVCAGRTDAGVHAAGQVAHFDTELWSALGAPNARSCSAHSAWVWPNAAWAARNRRRSSSRHGCAPNMGMRVVT